MNDLIAIIGLTIISIGLGLGWFLDNKDKTSKLNDAIKAVMSRNIGEYLAATKPISKDQFKPVEEDNVDLDTSDDKTFEKALSQM